ncbi:gamma-glutamyl-gamma-aminobutyrate hydrolase family protein [Streptomyces sp. NBC_01190]|uniref:gamma-glutamyl-gamma-aminobutyrate hydrolase family protein n=1 Tax=Streptomyces sp. NBC_01190 TaxID=2903767 RepID=UPI003862F2D5|nr:gamma-glutamyl-gamma-aminobutyrate hydrolase family protein [Streptomyces sp. NBC_01190]
MLVGITTYVERARWGVWEQDAALLPYDYVRSVRAAGAIAVLLPPDRPAAAAEVVARMDAVIVSGGPDVDPGRYGQVPHPRTVPALPERDAWEAAVLQAALERGRPLLGVCRGMQLLNVVLGGTLVQHLDGHVGEPGRFGSHRVTPVSGTLLAGLMPEAADVPTYHHQAVDRLGSGLTAAAHADDGTVEAVEAAGGGFALGVQWHPEAGTDPGLLTGLLAAARNSGTVTAVT